MVSEKTPTTIRIIFFSVFLICLPAFIGGFFESIKPTNNYVENVSTLAWIASFLTLILIFISMFMLPWSKIEGQMKESKMLLSIIFTPFFFAIISYQSFIVGIPVLLYPVSNPQPVEIELLISEKDYDRARGVSLGWTCRYKLRFEHPDIPERNYLCATESYWEQVEENSVLTVSAQKSNVAYYIPKLK